MIDELQPDVMIISETSLSPDILNSDFFLVVIEYFVKIEQMVLEVYL